MNPSEGSPLGRTPPTRSTEAFPRVPVRAGLAFLALAAVVVALSWPSIGERGLGAPPAAAPQAAPAPPSPAPDEPPGSIPVRLTFVDALTGEPMPSVRWRRRARLAPSELVARWEAGWHRSGDAAPLPPPFDDITVDAPDGYVALPPLVIPSFPIPRARAAALTVLLEREAIVTVVPLPWIDVGGGNPVRVNVVYEVTEAEVAGTPLRSDVFQIGDSIHGIPYRRGALLRLVLRIEGGGSGEWCGTGRVEESASADPDLEWWGRMGEDATTPILVNPVLPVGALGVPPPDLARESWQEPSLVEPDDLAPRGGMVDLTVRGTVRVRLLDRTGHPASGVQVAVRSVRGRTDRDGSVTLERVPGGEHFLRVLDEGWVFPLTHVTVADDEVSDAVARELLGGEVEVRVEDANGRPVPLAALAFRREDRRSFWDLDDAGVRRLDPYVGTDGRRAFRHVPPGALAVRAKVGTREGQARVEVVDGARQVVTITLPRLPPPPP